MNHTAGLTVTCPGMASLVLSLHAESWSPWVVPLASLHSAHLCHGTLNMTAWPCSASLVWQQGRAQLEPFLSCRAMTGKHHSPCITNHNGQSPAG